MNNRQTTLERAFELAQSGACASISEIKARLTLEGFADAGSQLYGPSLRKQLTKLCNEAAAKAGAVS